MDSHQDDVEEWLIPTVVLRVVTVIAVLVSLVQGAVWGTICLMTLDLKYPWWLWSTLIAGAVVGALWAYNAILARIVDTAGPRSDAGGPAAPNPQADA